MQIRTESRMKLLLSLWEGRESAVLSFHEIKRELGWSSSKADHLLKLAISEGYLGKAEGKGQNGYRNRMADYSGYFDGFEYLAEIDKHSRKSGKIQMGDQYLRTFSPLHLVEYGIPKEEELTPLERELAFTIRARFAHAFEDYTHLCEAIEWRQEIERFKKMPDSARSLLFARDEVKDKDMPMLSVRAAWMLYGDVLWEHIFEKIMEDIRHMLVQGTLDATGPIELFHAHKPLWQAASQVADLIHKGKASAYDDPDPATTEKLLKLKMKRDPTLFVPMNKKNPPDIAVIVTHSPRTMGGYSYQIGTMVRDQYSYWSEDRPEWVEVVEKSESKWEDKVRDVFGITTRREAFVDHLAANICNMRAELNQPISDTDLKFMLKDQKLREVLTEEQVLQLVERVRKIVGRAKKFRIEISHNKTPSQLVNDPDWFTQAEMDRYSFLGRYIPPAYKAPKGGKPPDLRKFESKVDDLIDDLDRKWPQWNLKERSRKGKGQSGPSTGSR